MSQSAIPSSDDAALRERAEAAAELFPEPLRPPDLVPELVRYWQRLLITNQNINLVSRRNTLDHIQRFTRESLFLAGLLAEDRDRLARPRPLRLLDLGSGGGFPGIVLKIALPDVETQLVEGTQKKARFLADCCAALRFRKCAVVWGRGEELGQRQHPSFRPEFRHHFDWVTTKALGTLQVSTRLADPFLAPDGAHWTFKGKKCQDELRAASGLFRQRGFATLRIEPIPGQTDSCVVGIRRLPADRKS